MGEKIDMLACTIEWEQSKFVDWIKSIFLYTPKRFPTMTDTKRSAEGTITEMAEKWWL